MSSRIEDLEAQLCAVRAELTALRSNVLAAAAKRRAIERYAIRLLGWDDRFDQLTDRDLMIVAITGADRRREMGEFDDKSDDWVEGVFDGIQRLYPAVPRARVYSHGFAVAHDIN